MATTTILRRTGTTVRVTVRYHSYGGFLGLLCGLAVGAIAYRHEPWAMAIAPVVSAVVGASYFETLIVDQTAGAMRFDAYLLFVRVRSRVFEPGDRVTLYDTFSGTEGIVIAERTPRETILSTEQGEQVVATLGKV
jgi:hypothetical protein